MLHVLLLLLFKGAQDSDSLKITDSALRRAHYRYLHTHCAADGKEAKAAATQVPATQRKESLNTTPMATQVQAATQHKEQLNNGA